MAQSMMLDGREVARPDTYCLRDGDIWGYFFAAEANQYDTWLYWGPATPESLEALRKAGVPDMI